MSLFLADPERFASYVVGPDRVFFVTTIDYRNPRSPSFDCHESGIREITRVKDGMLFTTYEESKKYITFELCQHNIYPLRAGHDAVIQALKDGVEPKAVYDYLRRRND